MAAGRSKTYGVKKWVNDTLRRLTGYQFIKAESLKGLETTGTKAGAPPRKRASGKPGGKV